MTLQPGQVTRRWLEAVARSVKGPSYTLDPEIDARELVSIGRRRTVAGLRGLVRGHAHSVNPRDWVFISRGVEIRNRHKVSFGRGVTVGRGCIIDGLSSGGVRLGDQVAIGQYSIIEATGVITNLGEGFVLGDRSSLGCFCFVGAAGGVRVGNDVIMGNRVSFHSENHNFDDVDTPIREQGVNRQGIEIEDDCWVGANVVFLDGARVGRGCVIAAGSVVRGQIPAYSVAAGVPAKVVRNRRDDTP